MANPFSVSVSVQGATGGVANVFARIGVNTLLAYVHGQVLSCGVGWGLAPGNYVADNRIRVYLGNAGGITKQLRDFDGTLTVAQLAGPAVGGRVEHMKYGNGLGNGIQITANDVDIWIASVNSNTILFNVEMNVWMP